MVFILWMVVFWALVYVVARIPPTLSLLLSSRLKVAKSLRIVTIWTSVSLISQGLY
jgi:hypothetical protein